MQFSFRMPVAVHIMLGDFAQITPADLPEDIKTAEQENSK